MRSPLRVWLCALTLVLPLPVLAAPFSSLFVFGDSLSDSGNLYTWSDAPNPVTNGTPIPVAPPYSPGRFQNGPSYAELLWDQLGLAGDLTPSLQGGTNYAVGGARSRYHQFDLQAGLPPANDPATFRAFSLLGQLEQYERDRGGAPLDANALYLVWGGSNDLQDVLTLAGRVGRDAAAARLQQAVSDVAFVIDTLVARGARQLLVPTAPDIGVVPAVVAQGAQAAGSAYSRAFNGLLDQSLAGLATSSDVRIARYDVFALIQDLAANPGDFGLTDTTTPCLQNFYVASILDTTRPVTVCTTPNDRLFWDIVHPSARTHQILAQGMRATVPEPATAVLLAVGIAAVGLRRRRPCATSLRAD
jgi:phospholipase/lecithinase/hemolysin